jgi:RimJ/RimL family protein N-acetyltransferase
VTAPVLETARLRLRPFRTSDLDAQAVMLGDPEIMRHLGGKPLTREESWRRMLCAPGLWTTLGYGYWAVERREDGALLGQIGFGDFKRDMRPCIVGLPEMGWIFARHAQGRGHAVEAGAAALAWIDGARVAAEIVAIIAPGNTASIRVARKLGFGTSEPAVYKGEPILLFRRRSAGAI